MSRFKAPFYYSYDDLHNPPYISGPSDGKGGVTRFEDWHQPEALPQECMAVPALETATYHDRCVSSDRKYESEAFNALWNWARAERVRL